VTDCTKKTLPNYLTTLTLTITMFPDRRCSISYANVGDIFTTKKRRHYSGGDVLSWHLSSSASQ